MLCAPFTIKVELTLERNYYDSYIKIGSGKNV